MATNTGYLMAALQKLGADESILLADRIEAGAAKQIKDWANQAGEDDTQRRRMLEALNNEITPMATTDVFWETIQKMARLQIEELSAEPPRA